MLPKISLLEELKKGGYEASLITTFNAYLPFYEEVVLRRLVNAGVRHNVLLMDARQYAASLATHPPRLAGRQYTLMPVSVPGAFHPKLIVLAGKQKAIVFVGSHNMTLAGFGFNRELTNLVRIQRSDDAAGISLAREVWKAIDDWLAEYSAGVPERVKDMVRRVQDLMPWIKSEATPDESVRLLVGRPGGRPLWDQLKELVVGDVATVAIGGAFFDQQLAFLARVEEDLRPTRITVAVDANTVQLPSRARSLTGVEFVSASSLGASEEGTTGAGYLHAKSILVQHRNGEVVLATGSANPSAPAWLANSSGGNVELMIARRGASAKQAADALGVSQIPGMPTLEESDWASIGANASKVDEHSSTGHRNGLGVVENGRVVIDRVLVADVETSEFTLVAFDGSESQRTRQFAVDDDSVVIEFSEAELSRAGYLCGYDASQLTLKVLLHHSVEVEEQSRSGTQRRFKEALLSLETDAPNIELLIHCIDKIVFAEERVVTEVESQGRKDRVKVETDKGDAPSTLAIDVGEMKKRKAKKRLNHSSDFGYLLDALIYHLRIHEDKSIEERDRHGRSEEEQIDADDDLEAEDVQVVVAEHEALLRLCHAKVATVVSRMNTQLEAFSEGKRPLADVLIRVLAVLAVLRELRGCDGRVVWVEKGKTTVPPQQRVRLLEGIMLNVFERNRREGNSSLLNLAPLGDSFQASDDVARLKGMVLWLAWDCGLTLNLRKPFNENLEDFRERLKRNAMVLALAQMISKDEVVIDEARQSIGSLTSSEMDWLTDVQRLADRCEEIGADPGALKPASNAEPGDVAVHVDIRPWDLRLVSSNNGSSVSLIRLSKARDSIAYTPDHLTVTQLDLG